MRSLRPWLRHAEKASTNRPSCRHPRPILDRTAAALLSLPRIGRPQDHQGCRCHRDRPRARRIPLGRDGPLTLFREPCTRWAADRYGHSPPTLGASEHRRRRTDPRDLNAAPTGRRNKSGAPTCASSTCGSGPRTSEWRHAVPTRPVLTTPDEAHRARPPPASRQDRRRQRRSSSLRCGRSTLTAPRSHDT